MKKSRLYGAVCAYVFSLISIPSHAALVDNGDGLIYDTVLDITWAQPDGQRNWDDANTWASELTLGGVSGWRLPYISVAAGAGPLALTPGAVDCSTASEVDCQDNELGYMFYHNLGGTFGEPIPPNGDPDVLALFPTLQAESYWSGTESIPGSAWFFGFAAGAQVSDTDDRNFYSWAVHEGNVVPVPEILAASLPSSRSVQVGSLASAFATIINTSDVAATGCGMAPQTSVVADFAYQTTDAANAPVGSPNTPIDIPAGASQNFVFGFVPTAPIDPTVVLLDYDCTNSEPAPVTAGVNTLLLSASSTPVPDIVALVSTVLVVSDVENGIVDIGDLGFGAFAVATVNLGVGDDITVIVETGDLPVTVTACETDPSTADCINPTEPSLAPVVTNIAADARPTFSFFVTALAEIPFDPANNRIVVRFVGSDGVTRGATSVAVRTQ